MKIKITITTNKDITISLDQELNISRAFDILVENGIITNNVTRIYSSRLEQNVNPSLTFKQARIQTGDRLICH